MFVSPPPYLFVHVIGVFNLVRQFLNAIYNAIR